jgi:hypothetical protein
MELFGVSLDNDAAFAAASEVATAVNVYIRQNTK